jgi:DNA gyrase subunit A
MTYEDIGVELQKFFPTEGGIKAVMELPTMDILKVDDESLGLVFITKKGFAKRVKLSEFKKITDHKLGISLNDDDEVASAMFTTDSSLKDIIISTNLGNGIRLPLSEVRTVGIGAKGSAMVTLQEGEIVVSASLINPKKKLLFYLTSSGRAKITEMKYFPVMDRKGETVNLISLQGNETLIGVSTVDKNDIVLIYKKHGDPEQIEIKSLTPGTRVSKGEKLVKTGRGDAVVAYKVFKS